MGRVPTPVERQRNFSIPILLPLPILCVFKKLNKVKWRFSSHRRQRNPLNHHTHWGSNFLFAISILPQKEKLKSGNKNGWWLQNEGAIISCLVVNLFRCLFLSPLPVTHTHTPETQNFCIVCTIWFFKTIYIYIFGL